VFGEDGSKGLRLDPRTLSLSIVDAKERPDEVLVHDETNATLAQLLLGLGPPEFPVALGVIYRNPAPRSEQEFVARHPTQMKRTAKIADALRQTSTWVVEYRPVAPSARRYRVPPEGPAEAARSTSR